MTFLILACAIPGDKDHKAYWPFFVILFYVISVIPLIIAKRRSQDTSGTNPCLEFGLFITAGIILSTFALPIVLARSGVITWLGCTLTEFGNIIIYLTILGYALKEAEAEGTYGGMF